MTKKKKISPVRKYQSLSFKVEETVLQTPAKSMPLNLAEEKEKFLKSGKTPQFQVQDPSKLAELASKTRNQIRFDLQGEAEYILEKVRDQYGQGELFLEHAYGPRITKDEATPMLLKYIEENQLTESIKIHWCDNLACSAKMVWTGPVVNANKPELRRYSLWINGSDENNYLRESGIKCLMDHEIGTHFFRMVNDGFQPWFSDRARFGIRSLGAFEGQCTEEGLAAINTALRGRVKLLWSAALAYNTACKATEMTFKQLFDYLGRYISNREFRWKQVMRIKRGLADPNDLGGFGNDQCYFEGAVTILRNMDNIDFYVLMSGKVCYDELERIKRVVRRDVVKYPVFMKNMNAYLRTLKKMSLLNNLGVVHPLRNPPTAYLRRLDERRAEESGRKPKKVRAYNRLRRNSFLKGKFTDRTGKGKQKESETEEVKSFAVSQKFVNVHQNRKMAAKKNEEEGKVLALVQSLSQQIRNVDESLDEHISHLKDIVNEHSWASEDNEYKENLLCQASSEINYNDLDDEASVIAEREGEGGATDIDDGMDTADEKESVLSSSKKSRGGNVQERPWTEGTRSASSLRSEFALKKRPLGSQQNSVSESLPNLSVAERRNCPKSYSTNILASLKPAGHSQVEFPGELQNCKGDVFYNRRLNLQRQKQLLHPSVARLTTRENLSGQKPKIKERLRIIENVIKTSEEEESLFPFRLGKSEELSVNVSKNSFDSLNTDGEEGADLKGRPSTGDLNNFVAKVYEQEYTACMENEMIESNPRCGTILVHHRPRKLQSFQPSQTRSGGDMNNLSLLETSNRAEVGVVPVKLDARSKENCSFLTISTKNILHKSSENGETDFGSSCLNLPACDGLSNSKCASNEQRNTTTAASLPVVPSGGSHK